MKKNGLVIVGLVIVVVIVIFSIKSCNSPSSSDAWAKLDVFDDKLLASNVEKYYDATMGYETETDQVFDVYTEMSMDFGYMAYKMPHNKEFAGDIFFEMNKIHHYKIEKSGVVDGGILIGKDEIMSKIDDPSVYKSSGVDIEEGINQLVEKNRPALLITDFELWDEDKGKELSDKAIYNKHFKDWLGRPNHSITFYSANFCDAATDASGRAGAGQAIMKDRFHKRLFFAFFDVDKNKTFSDSALPVKIPSEFTKLVVDIAPYKISTQYASLTSSGIGMGLENQVTRVLQGLPNQKAFEFINISKYNWEYIDKTIQTKKNEPFFTKLFVDASDNAAFDLNKIGVKVYDVTDDYTFFTRCNYAKTLKPKIIQDKNGKDVFDPSSNPITKEVYNPTTKKLKPEWIYGIAIAKNSPIYQEIFEINNTLVKNTKSKSPKRISVETKIHPAYSLNKITQKNGLLRVDIIAKDVTKNYASFDQLAWDTPGNNGGTLKKNTSLVKSIQSALKDLNGGQVIYSYYIRVAPSKK